MTSGVLREAGEQLYGPHWHTALAAALEMNRRTIMRYAGGEREIPPEVWAAIGELVARRRRCLARLLGVIVRPKRRSPRKKARRSAK